MKFCFRNISNRAVDPETDRLKEAAVPHGTQTPTKEHHTGTAPKCPDTLGEASTLAVHAGRG